ncbi:hypothetical protein LAZ67_1007635 [Cordylochernes scorpioides]|uniref:Uncharacterized protein n=1 Tax=Cordylochernes scorpioides TaxID=51811 RepID=A0ABY6JZG1_9ARAC|nr:hypothetical protein LAZ67_1007635 [Cordylochernes scorpioides]
MRICDRWMQEGTTDQRNHKRLRRQWCDERRMRTAEWNEIVFIDVSRFCLQHHDGRIRVWRTPWREDAEKVRYAPPHWSCTGRHMALPLTYREFLTNEQKLCRLATCEDMLEMTRTDPEWKDKIITGDETWVYGYDPETKLYVVQAMIIMEFDFALTNVP